MRIDMKKKESDPAAVSLGRRGGQARAANRTPEQRSAEMKTLAEERWKNVSDEERAAFARKLVKARERKRKLQPHS